MHQHGFTAASQLVVCAPRSPAEAGNQYVRRTEIRRAALRTESSNTNSRRRAPDPAVEPKTRVSVFELLEHNFRGRSAPAESNTCLGLGSARLPASSAPKEQAFFRHKPGHTSTKTRRQSQSYWARSLRHPHVRPNPSFKRSANGRPPAPGRWYAVHFHRPGAGVLPLSPT